MKIIFYKSSLVNALNQTDLPIMLRRSVTAGILPQSKTFPFCIVAWPYSAKSKEDKIQFTSNVVKWIFSNKDNEKLLTLFLIWIEGSLSEEPSFKEKRKYDIIRKSYVAFCKENKYKCYA